MREEKMYDILQASNDGPCRVHFSYKRTTYKVLHQGYYCPTLFKDAIKYTKSCDSFQWMGIPIVVDEIPMQTQVIIEQFEKWELEFVGPISPLS